jgi:hypothetical protein
MRFQREDAHRVLNMIEDLAIALLILYVTALFIVCKSLDTFRKPPTPEVKHLDVIDTGEHLVPMSGLYTQSMGRGLRISEGKPTLLPLDTQTCTRPAPHLCKINGPCNGFPKEN